MHIVQDPLELSFEIIDEREIPSDVALVTPLVVRLVERLTTEGFIDDAGRMKIELCLDEAITNAVTHGNRSDFNKVVKIWIFRDEQCWGIAIQDEGEGFSMDDITVSAAEDTLWQESGRGIPLMTLYMDEVRYFDGGRTLVLKKAL